MEIVDYLFLYLELYLYWNPEFLKAFKPQQPIKSKLLLSMYSQLYVVQYGEFGR